MVKNSLPGLVKWIIIGVIALIIYQCIRTDSRKYVEGAEREDFYDFAQTGGEDRDQKMYPASKPDSEDNAEKPGTCGDSGSLSGRPSGSPSKTCGGEGGCISATGARLLPVLDPCFNMREICKQCILLEDHLFQTEKRCEDCIKKHFLTLEGLSEEAITLDKENKYQFSKLSLPEKIRKLEKDFLAKRDPEMIAQELRQIRKPLMNKYFDRF